MSRSQDKAAFGQAGETKASEYLSGLGWRILARRVRFGQYELDVVAYDPRYQEIVFVEVKTRHSDYSGDPAEAVDQRKLQAFIHAGTIYARQHHLQTDYRFDIVSVTPQKIEHFENVTFP